MGVPSYTSGRRWGDLTHNARIVISFCYFVIHLLRGIVQTASLGEITSIDLWASTLSFLTTMSVTLMLRRERP